MLIRESFYLNFKHNIFVNYYVFLTLPAWPSWGFSFYDLKGQIETNSSAKYEGTASQK